MIELQQAVFSLPKGKVPGSDGIPSEFYQSCWDTIKDELFITINLFFKKFLLPNQWNETIISCIPKSKNAYLMEHFRPISLCNTIFKIISSILVSRWRSVINRITKSQQFGFLAGRDIADAVLIVQELWHSINHHPLFSNKFLLKLDLQKAYDKVNWNFLFKLLERMGYHKIWIQWIRLCVTTVSFRVNIQGIVGNLIVPTRGIRQGDPISPFLFISITGALTSIIDFHIQSATIKGIRFLNSDLIFTHIMFADDIIIRGEISLQEIDAWNSVLRLFTKAAGQTISLTKSELKVNLANIKISDFLLLHNRLSFPTNDEDFVYLGVAISRTRPKIVAFNNLVNRFYSCLNLWEATHLSLPVHALSWKEVCRPVKFGGFGFKSTEVSYQLLIRKQAAKLIWSPNSDWAKLIFAKYFLNNRWNSTYRTSAVWKVIFHELGILGNQIFWKVGSNKKSFGGWPFFGPSLFSTPIFRLFFFPSSSPSYPRGRLSLHSEESEIKRPICIITGVTSGLGAAAATALAAEGYHVVLVGRSPKLLCETGIKIKQKHENAYLKAFQVDLASIHSIKKFERSLKQWLSNSNLHPSVQLLINNAGILATSSRVTSDGFDQMMETNYIGAFVLTNLLLPLLKNSPIPSRIVNVTSFTHRSVLDVRMDRKSLFCLPTSGQYPCACAYEYSKLCLLLFSYELHRQLQTMNSSSNISVNVVDPGAVETNIMRELPRFLSQTAFSVLCFLCLLQSPEDGVGAIIDAALAPPEVSGKYFFGGKGRTIQSSSLSYDAKLAEDLWSISNDLFQEALQLTS